MHNKRMMGLAFCIALFAMSAAAQTLAGSVSSGQFGSTTGGGTYSFPGNVGIGTTNPGSQLTVQGSYNRNQFLVSQDGTDGIFFQADGANTHYNWQISQQNFTNGTLQFTPSTIAGGTTFTTPALTLRVNGSSSNIGIGTMTPLYNLDVTGTIRATAGVVFPDGTTQVTAFLPANCGADYAEAVDVSGDRTKYEPGDVLVIDPSAPGKFLKANQAYSTLVAGIYSTKPGFVGRLAPADPRTKDKEVPMAMVGRVPTKVSAENGPIKVGDLLVASSRMGYAMKGTDRGQMLGAVIGKALGSLDSGTGVIEVLVTLQ
jgi:hypothetical protein